MNLIIYYSRKGQNYFGGAIQSIEKGNTEICAEYIRKAVGGDLFEIDTVKPYSEDYMTCTEEAKAELRANARPELKNMLTDVSQYDNIFVCGPCWWGRRMPGGPCRKNSAGSCCACRSCPMRRKEQTIRNG